MHKASRQPEMLSSDSSNSDKEAESLFMPQSPRGSRCSHKPSREGSAGPRANINRGCESPVRQGLDRDLQTFISMRDQTDKATEVREYHSVVVREGINTV